MGGHCISVDPWFLVEAAPKTTPLIRQARQVNDSQPEYVFKLLEKALGGSVRGKRVAALGLAYKPDVDDLRESPAVEVVNLLAKAGAVVKANEPFKPEENFDGFETTTSLLTSARFLIDAVNGWCADEWGKAGFSVARL